MLAFQNDKATEVKKFVIGFIEAAWLELSICSSCFTLHISGFKIPCFLRYSKVDNEILPNVMANLLIMLANEAVAVQKRVIQATPQIYKVVLKVCSINTACIQF